jgi:hypothetical protein
LLVAGLALLVARPTAAANPKPWDVVESKRFDDTVLREFDEVEKDPELTFEIDAAVKRGNTKVTLTPHARRYCTTRKQALIDRHEVITRTPANKNNGLTLAYGLGIAAVGGAGVGLAVSGVLKPEPDPDPLAIGREPQDGSGVIGVLGGLTIAYGSIFAGPALVATINSRDSRTHIGEVTLTRSTKRDVCETVDLTGASVELVPEPGGASTESAPVATGTVNARGSWTLDLASIDDLTKVTGKRVSVTVTSPALPKPGVSALPERVVEQAKTLGEARAWDAMLEQEIASGQCSERTLTAMQTQIDFLNARSFQGGLLVEKDIFVVDESRDMAFTASLPGTYKLWLFGASPVELTATNARGQRQPSDDGGYTVVGASLDAVRVSANAGERFALTIKGRGCTALAVLME